jgi:hypothetical protein
MSSSASTPTHATEAPAVPHVSDAAEAHEATSNSDQADRTYGKAIIIGSIAGIVLFTVAAFLALQALAPDWSGGANAIIAVWMGIWAGLFLGGTIAVGRWSMRQGH